MSRDTNIVQIVGSCLKQLLCAQLSHRYITVVFIALDATISAPPKVLLSDVKFVTVDLNHKPVQLGLDSPEIQAWKARTSRRNKPDQPTAISRSKVGRRNVWAERRFGIMEEYGCECVATIAALAPIHIRLFSLERSAQFNEPHTIVQYSHSTPSANAPLPEDLASWIGTSDRDALHQRNPHGIKTARDHRKASERTGPEPGDGDPCVVFQLES
ncbi:hypothetical protein PQX77_014827 [Marasmius sp. AFHP31]|nr:hypothetical protein PQX77_014827 [Marasmius sp. AFHP31]